MLPLFPIIKQAKTVRDKNVLLAVNSYHVFTWNVCTPSLKEWQMRNTSTMRMRMTTVFSWRFRSFFWPSDKPVPDLTIRSDFLRFGVKALSVSGESDLLRFGLSGLKFEGHDIIFSKQFGSTSSSSTFWIPFSLWK